MKYYAAILTTIVFFSTIEVVTKLVVGEIDVFFLAFLRFHPAGLILLSVGARRLRLAPRKDLLQLGLLGLIGVPVAFGAFHLSLKYIDASTGAVIFSLNPIFSSFTAAIVLGERLNSRIFGGLLLGLVGVYFVSFGFTPVGETGLFGPVLMLVSAVAFGVYISLSKPFVKRYGPIAVTGFMFTFGSFLFLPFVSDFRILNPSRTLLGVGYLTLFATGLAYVLYFYGLRKLPIAGGASLFYLKPALATSLAAVVLDEQIAGAFLLGLAAVLGALALIISGKTGTKTNPKPGTEE